MTNIYTVPTMPCQPDWGVMLKLLAKPTKVDRMKTCAYPPCENEFRSTNRQHHKEYCSDECLKAAEAFRAKARRATRTHRLQEEAD
jgi:hypothetical protein